MINWPDRFHPSRAPIHVRNELVISAKPEIVWMWLIRAVEWPKWYPNAHRVRIGDGRSDLLTAGCRFIWRTFGVSLRSHVEEFVPNERIAWSALGVGVDVYHAWVIEPRGSTCRVVTEETQYGWAARLGHLLMPRRMHKWHQIWLERLSEKAGSGMP